jgi:hypothetical protein
MGNGLEPKRWSVGVVVQTNYTDGSWWKTRYCNNTHGAKSYHECRYDHREHYCVHWAMYEFRDGTRRYADWGDWYDTATGARMTARECGMSS